MKKTIVAVLAMLCLVLLWSVPARASLMAYHPGDNPSPAYAYAIGGSGQIWDGSAPRFAWCAVGSSATSCIVTKTPFDSYWRGVKPFGHIWKGVTPAGLPATLDPNSAYNFGIPGLYAQGVGWVQVRYAWCNNGLPTVTAFIVDVTTGGSAQAPNNVIANACEAQVLGWQNLRRGDLYKTWQCDLHQNCSPLLYWTQQQ